MSISRLVLALVLACASAWASPVSAQTSAPPPVAPPEASAYAVPAPPATTTSAPVIVVTPTIATAPMRTTSAPAAFTCPPDGRPDTDVYGRPICVTDVHEHTKIGLLLGFGIGALVGGYVASILTTILTGSSASTSSSDYNTWGEVPLLGPWVQMGFMPRSTDDARYLWNAVEGLLQLAGVVMIIVGAIGEDHDEVRPMPGYALRVTPIVGATTQGLELVLQL